MTDNGKEVIDVPGPERKGRKPKQEHLPGQEPQPKSRGKDAAAGS